MPRYFNLPPLAKLAPPPAVRPPNFGEGIGVEFDPGTFDAARRIQSGISYQPDSGPEIQDGNSKPPVQNPSPDAPEFRARPDSPRATEMSEKDRLDKKSSDLEHSANNLGLASVFGNAGDSIARGLMSLGGVPQGVDTGNKANLRATMGLRREALGEAERAKLESRDIMPEGIRASLSGKTGVATPLRYSELSKLSPLMSAVAHIEAQKSGRESEQAFRASESTKGEEAAMARTQAHIAGQREISGDKAKAQEDKALASESSRLSKEARTSLARSISDFESKYRNVRESAQRAQTSLTLLEGKPNYNQTAVAATNLLRSAGDNRITNQDYERLGLKGVTGFLQKLVSTDIEGEAPPETVRRLKTIATITHDLLQKNYKEAGIKHMTSFKKISEVGGEVPLSDDEIFGAWDPFLR